MPHGCGQKRQHSMAAARWMRVKVRTRLEKFAGGPSPFSQSLAIGEVTAGTAHAAAPGRSILRAGREAGEHPQGASTC